MSSSTTTLLESAIRGDFPFLFQAKNLIAISGGVDSVVLTDVYMKLGIPFHLAHCNFRLRGQASDEDEDFVRKLARRYGVKLFVKRFETLTFAKKQKLSVQEAARKLRYLWFENLSGEENFDYVSTAHHLDDQIGTFFINLVRGTGIEGLTGIPETRANIVRPFLKVPKSVLLEYAQKNSIRWREDQSNASDDYLRNRIRHHLVPELKKIRPSYRTGIQKTQEHLRENTLLLREYDQILWGQIAKPNGGFIEFDLQKLRQKKHPQAVLYRLLKGFGFTAWRDIARLMDAQSGRQVFSATHRLVRDREKLVLVKTNKDVEKEIKITEDDEKTGFPGGVLSVRLNVKESFKKKAKVAYIPPRKLVFPLKLRRWCPGDRFRPLGMEGTKKVSDFLTDEKCSLSEKENTWVLLSDEKIAWVVGKRLDERFKAEKKDANSIKFSVT